MNNNESVPFIDWLKKKGFRVEGNIVRIPPDEAPTDKPMNETPGNNPFIDSGMMRLLSTIGAANSLGESLDAGSPYYIQEALIFIPKYEKAFKDWYNNHIKDGDPEILVIVEAHEFGKREALLSHYDDNETRIPENDIPF